MEPKGICLPCPRCGEPEATVQVNLADVNDFHCCECSEEFDANELRDLMARWTPVLAWLDTIPQRTA